MKTQNNIERITSLLVLFLENQGILSKDQIFKRLKSFYFDSNISSEKNAQNANRKFERDKKTLEELGFTIQKVGKNQYQLSDLNKNTNIVGTLTKQEEEKLSELILKRLPENPDGYLILYLKLFYKNIEYIKKLLKINLKNLKIESFISKRDTSIMDGLEKVNQMLLKKQPFKIFYFKKNSNEIIERNIFPLVIYSNRAISYLVSWDYEKKDIRSFIIENIKKIEELDAKSFKKIKKSNTLSNVKEEKNYILIPYKWILERIPHPINIPDSEILKDYKVILTIKKEYFELYKSFFNQNVKKAGSYKSYIVIEVITKNLKSIFYWISKYSDSVVSIEPEEIKNNYKKFLEDIVEFYQNFSYAVDS